jgi:hypothetical protein
MRSALVELCLDLSWGQWAALGVSASGWIVPQSPVDLEAAIAFAPVLADIDPRLHAEALDWCIAFANDFVSVTSLRHALAAFDEEHRVEFDRFASIVNKQGATKWPVREPVHPDSFRPSGKSQCRTDHAACVQLRARKVFGINARADILVGLALLPDSPQIQWTHVSLLRNLGYSKRALSEALNDLAGGGMLGTLSFGNTIRYALRKAEPLREILEPLPSLPGQPWSQRLAIAATMLRLQKQLASKSVTSQAIEIKKALERKRSVLEQGRMTAPAISAEAPWASIEAWLKPLLRP